VAVAVAVGRRRRRELLTCGRAASRSAPRF